VDITVLRTAIDDHNAATAASMVGGRPADDLLAYYAEDALEMPPGEPMVKGKEAMRQRSARLMQSGIKVKSMQFTPTDVQMANDIAYEIGTIQCSGTLGDGQPDVNYTGKYVVVWRKRTDGSWRIAADIWNPDAPMPALPTGGSSAR
jgi:ketosteroid isomerase-like protein